MLQLPSNLQPKDWCSLNFGHVGLIAFARVTKVIFSESSVFYDVEIPISHEPFTIKDSLESAIGWTRIHGLGSAFVSKLENVEPDGSIYKKGF